MKRILSLLMVLIFLSGCSLTTIKAYKKQVEKPQPVRETVVERVKEVFRPKPEPVVKEKEEVLPLEEEDIK